jgi:hypothetical protein
MPTRTTQEHGFLNHLDAAARESCTTNVERFANFPVWTPRQNLSRFLAQAALYQEVIGLHGSIVEVGVAFGAGLFAWAHLASIYEPFNHTRKVIGFDTWEGFPGMSAQDEGSVKEFAHAGGMAAPVYEELQRLAALHDLNRPVGHIPRIELVKGDASQTVPEYVKANQHLVVSLLVIDCDIYEPADIALRSLLPRMPPGAIVAWDEVGVKDWPGETRAWRKYKHEFGPLQRSPLTSTLSWAKVL